MTGPPFADVGEAYVWALALLEGAGLAFGHGGSSAEAEAEYLVLGALGRETEGLGATARSSLTAAESEHIRGLVEARIATREPAAYLLGRAYIGPNAFKSDARALVPRSFIGELLTAAIDGEDVLPLEREPARILDIGTGSGCLAILAALAYPDAKVDAVDISAAALELARENVAAYRLDDRVRLMEGDLFAPVTAEKYDLIITNPPYVTAASMEALPAEYRHEPALGLAGGIDGLDIVRRILAAAGSHLTRSGGLLCEIGGGREMVEKVFPELGFLWLDTVESEGEMFWIEGDALR